MSLDDIYMKKPAGRKAQLVMTLDPWPEIKTLTPAQFAARLVARRAQVGKPKAANRVRR